MDRPRLRRIAFVTRHYSAFRGGVTRALWAPLLLVVGIIELFRPFSGLPGVIFGFSNIFGVAAVGIWLGIRLNRWMDRRFGRVQSASPLKQGLVINLWMFLYLGAHLFDDRYTLGLPSAKFLVIAGAALWFSLRRWPYSLHYLVPAAIAIGFAIPFAGLRGEEAIDLWEFQAFGSTLLAWTAAGLIDLALLFRALPHRPQEATSVDAS